MVLFKFGWNVLFCFERQQNFRNLPAHGGHALIRQESGGSARPFGKSHKDEANEKHNPGSAHAPLSWGRKKASSD